MCIDTLLLLLMFFKGTLYQTYLTIKTKIKMSSLFHPDLEYGLLNIRKNVLELKQILKYRLYHSLNQCLFTLLLKPSRLYFERPDILAY